MIRLPKELTTVTWLSIILSGICFIFFVIVAFYLGMQYQQIQDLTEQQLINAQSIAVTQQRPVTQTKEAQHFSKRLFDKTAKFFSNQPYPSEILNIPEDSLTGLQCTKEYGSLKPDRNEEPFGYYDQEKKKYIKLTDKRLLGLVATADKTVSTGWISSLQLCEAQEKRGIVLYSMTLSGGGAGSNTYTTELTDNDAFKRVIAIPAETSAYFSCNKILQLTNTNNLYVQCGGGDGGTTAGSIYSINLTSGNIQLLKSCEETMQAWPEGTKVKTTCK